MNAGGTFDLTMPVLLGLRVSRTSFGEKFETLVAGVAWLESSSSDEFGLLFRPWRPLTPAIIAGCTFSWSRGSSGRGSGWTTDGRSSGKMQRDRERDQCEEHLLPKLESLLSLGLWLHLVQNPKAQRIESGCGFHQREDGRYLEEGKERGNARDGGEGREREGTSVEKAAMFPFDLFALSPGVARRPLRKARPGTSVVESDK